MPGRRNCIATEENIVCCGGGVSLSFMLPPQKQMNVPPQQHICCKIFKMCSLISFDCVPVRDPDAASLLKQRSWANRALGYRQYDCKKAIKGQIQDLKESRNPIRNPRNLWQNLEESQESSRNFVRFRESWNLVRYFEE